MTRRQWALVAVLVLINYIIFASLATVVLTHRARMSVPTRTPLPTFTVISAQPPVTLLPTAKPPALPSSTPTQYMLPTATPVVAKPTGVTPTAPQTQAPSRAAVTVSVGLRVRSGPGVDYPVVGSLTPGASADITGRDVEGTWWQILYEGAPGGRGWISANASYGSAQNTSNVPVVEAPPPPKPTAPPAPTAPPKPQWQFEPTGFEGQWNAGLAQIRGKVVDTAGQPVKGVWMQAKCGGTVLASNPSGTNLYAPSEPYEPGAFDIILSSPLSPSSMCRWEVRIVQANSFDEARNLGAPPLSDTAYCDLEWEVASICFTRWRKNW